MGRGHGCRRGEQMSIYDAAMRYMREGVALVVLAGKEYGSGSSRDWAAKGTELLGVRAVIAQSFERIHRSNLVGMGVLPLQFPEGQSAQSLGLTGEEVFAIEGLADAMNAGEAPREVRVRAERDAGAHGSDRSIEFDGERAHRHPARGRVLPPRRHPPVRAARAARVTPAPIGTDPGAGGRMTTDPTDGGATGGGVSDGCGRAAVGRAAVGRARRRPSRDCCSTCSPRTDPPATRPTPRPCGWRRRARSRR